MMTMPVPIVSKSMIAALPRQLTLLLAIFCMALCASPWLMASEADVLDHLNQVRKQAGMSPFVFNDKLAQAALNHAAYLHQHREEGHGEHAGRRGYTGRTPAERVNYAGYASTMIGENVSSHSGNQDALESIEGLMAAIYHRLAFLSFKFDEVGFGSMRTADHSSYVYKLGNQRKNQLCQQVSGPVRGRYYFEVCADERKRIGVQSMMDAEYQVGRASGEIVVWPADQSADIPPGFYKEYPDPLPSHDVSGYPVSVQFNPTYFVSGLPAITRFQLFKADEDSPVESIILMHAENDPNRKLLANEYALFPRHRLEWNTRYRVEVDYRVGGQQRQHRWSFTTRDMQLPMVTIDDSTTGVVARPGETFVLYLRPRGARDGESAYRTRYPTGMQLDIEIYDPHTLLITASGRPGQATITYHGVDIPLYLQAEERPSR